MPTKRKQKKYIPQKNISNCNGSFMICIILFIEYSEDSNLYITKWPHVGEKKTQMLRLKVTNMFCLTNITIVILNPTWADIKNQNCIFDQSILVLWM